MAITFVGALLHEVTLAQQDSDNTHFDADYAPYGLRTFPWEEGYVKMAVTPVAPDTPTYDQWIHFKIHRQGSLGGSGSLAENFFEVFDTEGDLLFGLERGANLGSMRLNLYSGGLYNALYSSNILGFLPGNYTLTYSFRLRQNATNHILDFYLDGILIRTLTRPQTNQRNIANWQIWAPRLATGCLFTLSEIMMTDGEPTLGARIATMSPSGLASTNTWTGTWESLGDEDTGSGVSTDQDNARITGSFSAYGGAASPVGIRAVVQSMRFVDNESGLLINGFLRSSATNNDTTDSEIRDESRVFTIWDQNPFTTADWTVADLGTVEGGVRTSPVP